MHTIRKLGIPVSRTLSKRSLSTNVNTVNDSEVALFSRLSSLWWDEQGEFGMLHKMNPVRMAFIRDKIREIQLDESELLSTRPLDGLDALDVGCGGGLLSESLARSGANTVAIDASESNIAIASTHAALDPQLSRGNLKYLHTTAESLVKETKRFDVVCSMEVIEHVDNPSEFLRICAELVKPGGHLFLSTMSRTPLAYALTIFAAERILRMVSPGTHTYSKYIKPSEMLSFFQEYSSLNGSRPWISQLYNGLPSRQEAETRGLIYVPWQGQWMLTSRAGSALESDISTQCNYMFWVRKPRE